MLPKIYNHSIIIYVCDLTNFEASIIPEVFEMVEKKRHRLILVANKVDAIPQGYKEDTLQLWVKNQIQKYFKDFKSLEQVNICLTSAKRATGIGKIFTILDRTKADFRMQKIKHIPKVYVMGTTNSGKSALLNSMLYV